MSVGFPPLFFRCLYTPQGIEKGVNVISVHWSAKYWRTHLEKSLATTCFSQSTSFGGIISVLSDDVKTTSFPRSLKTAQPPHSAQWSIPKSLIRKIEDKKKKKCTFFHNNSHQKVVLHIYLIVFWKLSNTETLANFSHFVQFFGNFETWKLIYDF